MHESRRTHNGGVTLQRRISTRPARSLIAPGLFVSPKRHGFSAWPSRKFGETWPPPPKPVKLQFLISTPNKKMYKTLMECVYPANHVGKQRRTRALF
jgi:hypothetical protein